jgi:small GTP-binding protein
MPDFDEILKLLPEKTQDNLNPLWERLPADERDNLKNIFEGIPLDLNLVDMLIDLSVIQVKMTLARKNQVAIVGPANVGKSTLYNQFIRQKEDRAEVSPIPGTTRANQMADAGIFKIIDTPGADAVGEVGERERKEALAAAEEADFLVIMFDAIQGIKETEQRLYYQLLALGKPYLVVLNKIDLAGSRHEDEAVENAADHLGLSKDKVIPISAKRGKNLASVLMGIVIADPELMIPLAQALPQYRWRLAWRAIVTAATISGVIALIPLPVIDFIPLVANQTTMVLAIARIYNYKITLKRAKELIATFGIGLLARTLFQQLSKLGGVPGWLLSSAIAASTTVAMGYAASVWFEKGERLSRDALNNISKSLTKILLSRLKGLFKKKPSRKKLKEALEESLSETELSDREKIAESAGETG